MSELKMTQEEFQQAAETFFHNDILPLLQNKGAQYSNGRAFVNFEEGSALFGITPGKYLMIMATKHWHNLCKNPDYPNGPVVERCIDIIVYMLLLIMMYKETSREQHQH